MITFQGEFWIFFSDGGCTVPPPVVENPEMEGGQMIAFQGDLRFFFPDGGEGDLES